MVKKVLLLAFMAVFAVFGAACGNQTPSDTSETNPNEAEFHIGICTSTFAQSEDESRGAEQLIKQYGDVKDGGMIKHVTYPDNFAQEQETVISIIAGLADDPKMKAIIVNQAVGGVAAAFKKIKETRPDILLIAAMPQEDPNLIESVADVITDPDNISRGYYIVKNAKDMGAKTFVHISFPRHMSIELLSRRRAIMEEACKDLGLKFAFETAPDPAGDVGVAGAQQMVYEMMPQLVAKYGKDTAFFCTNDAQTEPLIKQVANLGAIFVEPDTPSPLMGYPTALGVDLKAEAGDWPAIVKKIEEAVLAKNQSGRMGTPAYSFSYCNSVGLGEFAKSVIEGKAQKDDVNAIIEAFKKITPGAEWATSFYADANTQEVKKNHLLVLEDTYIFGKGYSGVIKEPVPEKYLTIK
ncbi:hypothetical protein DCMF_06055 [Candidatus Formimonas warabiya]|uniref:DUF3798 domain-containing protein n=2 Tax=Formimonas warabiya TaxID=1761012 RepID=A0A3G1L173_FORW1|nr:hypothetical protein DCMF_06055 [Candidatus Formimonas warabiya]